LSEAVGSRVVAGARREEELSSAIERLKQAQAQAAEERLAERERHAAELHAKDEAMEQERKLSAKLAEQLKEVHPPWDPTLTHPMGPHPEEEPSSSRRSHNIT
jgi:hypothetical protein